jgi:probable DNA metabolism protein
MRIVSLPRLGTFDAWRTAARDLASAGVPAQDVTWQMEGAAPTLFADQEDTLNHRTPRVVTVPKDFPPLAKLLCSSRAPGVFDLAYTLLLRLNDTPKLMTNRADPDMDRASKLAKNIRRDMHKMKAFVRFREVTKPGANRRQFISWFEPDHRIEELITGFFARRFGDMDWVIVTPEVTSSFEAGTLHHEAIHRSRMELSDDTEELWKTYYANIFNPARLKIKAMQSEMPKKYWKNLPEAALIPELIAGAEAKVAQMQAAQPSLPPVRAARVLDRLHDAPPSLSTGTMKGFLNELRGCARCPLAAPATQVVPGSGPQNAALMIVGEQPGDQEDLQGIPFVGPAGQMFDRLAVEAGLERQSAYVTNAVKHFKFRVKGKRRIHQSPSSSEVSHCQWWLEREVALVKPRLILALGATATLALTGSGNNITKRRGRIETGKSSIPVFITFHPSALLRTPDETVRTAQTDAVRHDLRAVAQYISANVGDP